jgi:hypothetical protein
LLKPNEDNNILLAITGLAATAIGAGIVMFVNENQNQRRAPSSKGMPKKAGCGCSRK